MVIAGLQTQLDKSWLSIREGFEMFMDYKVDSLRRDPADNKRFRFIPSLLMEGNPLCELKDVLGHANIDTTMIYAHLGKTYDQENKESYRRISKRIIVAENRVEPSLYRSHSESQVEAYLTLHQSHFKIKQELRSQRFPPDTIMPDDPPSCRPFFVFQWYPLS